MVWNALPWHLQNVSNFRNIHWSRRATYGDVNLQGEQEHSKYYFEIADVNRLRQLFNLFEAEAEAALEHGLVLPAHDYVLKCSHTFNVLDTRGAVGVTERQALFCTYARNSHAGGRGLSGNNARKWSSPG